MCTKFQVKRKFSAAVYKYDDDSRMIKNQNNFLILNTGSKIKDNLKGDDTQSRYNKHALIAQKIV